MQRSCIWRLPFASVTVSGRPSSLNRTWKYHHGIRWAIYPTLELQYIYFFFFFFLFLFFSTRMGVRVMFYSNAFSYMIMMAGGSSRWHWIGPHHSGWNPDFTSFIYIYLSFIYKCSSGKRLRGNWFIVLQKSKELQLSPAANMLIGRLFFQTINRFGSTTTTTTTAKNYR